MQHLKQGYNRLYTEIFVGRFYYFASRIFLRNQLPVHEYEIQELQSPLSLLKISADHRFLNTSLLIVSVVYWLKQIDQLSCSAALPPSITGIFSYANVTVKIKVEILIADINKTVKISSVQ
jgi:hypothetical protein